MKRQIIKTLFVATLLTSCGVDNMTYKGPNAPISDRVEDLLSRMTLEEKLAQMSHIHGGTFIKDGVVDRTKLDEMLEQGGGFVETLLLSSEECYTTMNYIQEYMLTQTRLGIPIFTLTESLHGSVQDGSTIFPQAIAMGSTFNPALINKMSRAIGKELYAQGVRQSLTPVLDVGRDLRWGRIEECFSEDPFLVSRIGAAQVEGYLSSGVSPMIKHFGAHAEPTGGLNLSSVSCSERELRDIHIKPFEYVVKRCKPWAVMSSYNSYNHIPNSASTELMTTILRDEWGFEGYIYSDWGAIGMLNYFHKVAQNSAEAAMIALKAGIDVEASSNCYSEIPNLIERGLLDPKYVDTAVRRILRAKFAMGLFEWQPTTAEQNQSVNNPDHIALAREIAEESIVLLQNDKGLLPLDLDKIGSIALIGPNADQIQFGDYTWSRNNSDGVTIRRALEQSIGDNVEINYAEGCALVSPDRSGFESAIRAAKRSDITIVVVGSASASLARDYSNATCGEGFDLHDISLTGVQEELVRELHKTGKDIVVVLLAGKPFAMPWIKENIPTVVTQWYSGEQGGYAMADVLTGRVNPSGRLNYSFPASSSHLPSFYNYLPTDKGYYKRPGTPEKPGKDYVFSSPHALWSFGHGGSYSTFDYSNLATDREDYRAKGDTIRLSVDVANTSKVDGKEVVQVYIRDIFSSVVTPIHELKGFSKLFIEGGESVRVEISIPIEELALYNGEMEFVVEPGAFEIQVGRASDNILLKKIVTVERERMVAIPLASQSGGEADGDTKIMVTGVVRDVQANTLSNIEVVSIYGSCTTNTQGEYSISAPESGELELRVDGKTVMTQAVAGNQILNITIVPQ